MDFATYSRLADRVVALHKAQVKAHQRRLRDGRTIEVRGHERKAREASPAEFSRSMGARPGQDAAEGGGSQTRAPRGGRTYTEEDAEHESSFHDLEHADDHDAVDAVRKREHARPGGPRKGKLAILDRHDKRIRRQREMVERVKAANQAMREDPKHHARYKDATKDAPNDPTLAERHHKRVARAADAVRAGDDNNHERDAHEHAHRMFARARSLHGTEQYAEALRWANEASADATAMSRRVAAGEENPNDVRFSRAMGAKPKRDED